MQSKPRKRQIKIRKKRNQQDAYPADCIHVTAVTFIAFRTAPPEQLKHYRLKQYDSDASDSSDTDSSVDNRETRLESIVQCQLMRMRRHRTTTYSDPMYKRISQHVRDHRSESTMAEAVLKLLEVRASELGYQGVWEDKYRTLPGLVKTDDQLKHAWNTTLKAMFKDEADDNEAKDEEAGLTY